MQAIWALKQASRLRKNKLLFLEYSYIERYSYFSYEYLKSTVRDTRCISQANGCLLSTVIVCYTGECFMSLTG
jgi:hypothetical protein